MRCPTPIVVALCIKVSPPEAILHDDDADAGKDEQRVRCPAGEERRERLAAEHVVDDDLQRPRLEQLETGNQEDLKQRPGEQNLYGQR